MGCSTCLQEKSKFYCNICVKESLFEYVGLKNNIVLNIPNIKEIVRNHYGKKINQLKTKFLKEQIVQFRLRSCNLASKVADYKLKNKEMRTQNHERRLKIEKYKLILNNLIKQSKSGKEIFISKIKEVEVDTQVRTGYTRKGLVCQLRSMVYFYSANCSCNEVAYYDSFLENSREFVPNSLPGQICINAGCNGVAHMITADRICPQIHFQRKDFVKSNNAAKQNSNEINSSASQQWGETPRPHDKFSSEFQGKSKSFPLTGGVLHLIRIVNQISGYLGKLLPFSVVYQESTPYIKHGFTHFQNISDIPLFLLDKIQDLHPLLVAISFYNLAYLCFTQSIVVTSEDYSSWAAGNWPNHLQQLFKIYQQRGECNVGRIEEINESSKNQWWCEALNSVQTRVRFTRLRYQLDPTFKFEFKELLSLITKHLKGNQAWTNLRYTCIDKNLLDDYFIPDRDTSKGEDEPWDIVDVVLPPTPSELHAAGI